MAQRPRGILLAYPKTPLKYHRVKSEADPSFGDPRGQDAALNSAAHMGVLGLREDTPVYHAVKGTWVKSCRRELFMPNLGD